MGDGGGSQLRHDDDRPCWSRSVQVARAALTGARRRFLRTARHPAVADLQRAGIMFESFDDGYDRAAHLDSLYLSIATTVLDAARHDDDVVYAVPGNPVVAERSVALL